MKKTITIILLSVAVLGAAGWMVWQQQTIKAAEEKHQQESKTNDEQLSKLTSDQADMKHENEDQKRNCLPSPKSSKTKRKPIKKKSSSVKYLSQKLTSFKKS